MADTRSANRRLATAMIMVVMGMLGLSFAAVPLYNMFCRITGYGGTTKQALHAPDHILDREIEVRFTTAVQKDLPWEFKADEKHTTVKIGEERFTSFTAKNTSGTPLYGTAIYNVTPHLAAEYFSKIQCFCFDSQLLEPGQEVHMPVSFFIDPKIADDPFLKDLKTVTLSYTFFLSTNQSDKGESSPKKGARNQITTKME